MSDVNKAKHEAVTLEHAQRRAKRFIFGIHSAALEGITYSNEFIKNAHNLWLDTSLTDEECYNIAIHWEP